ncbi:hypothetical protein [Xylanimonas protaetiae]|uniref:Uncharacterized protein n=1 Tax=Xylanimonas protaetiae TaxID=2509457 RepID=A0A4P6F1Q7_9MICO|nr:hypothetical protein [Xylanimonas protaetiae]QAY69065.1 hypothetical protein ET471_02575 [Xylanimonas protaetiae]
MDIDFRAIGTSILQVLVVGLLLGAGLPALFALGMRSLANVPPGHPFDPESDERPPTTTAGRVGAVVCFGLCVLVAAFGVVVIVFGKQMFGK